MDMLMPETFWIDHRGYYVELWNSTRLKHIAFVQDCTSVSHKNVLRGIHGDKRGCWKLVTCLLGDIWVVVVDPETKTWESKYLSHGPCCEQVLVPPHCGLGHAVLSDQAVFHYKQSQLYDRSAQFSIKWDDPEYGIVWPIDNPILSERDRLGPLADQS